MKVLILAGGYGTRIADESRVVPKPMIEIGGKPILWHIMKRYSQYGFNDFVVMAGYRGDVIKRYFLDYYLNSSSISVDLRTNSCEYFNSSAEPWRVTVLDTGAATMTGGRIKQAAESVGGETFLLTYGDGVADVDINALVEHHKAEGKLVTLTGVEPEGRFGRLDLDSQNRVTSFEEKAKGEFGRINGGFFVCEPQVLDCISDDVSATFERDTLEELAKRGEISCYRHEGFWKCMDTLADKEALTTLWESGDCPWRNW